MQMQRAAYGVALLVRKPALSTTTRAALPNPRQNAGFDLLEAGQERIPDA